MEMLHAGFQNNSGPSGISPGHVLLKKVQGFFPAFHRYQSYFLKSAGFCLWIHQRLTRNAAATMTIAPTTPIIIRVTGIPSAGDVAGAGAGFCVAFVVMATGTRGVSGTEIVTDAEGVAGVVIAVGTGVPCPTVVPPF